MSTPPPDNPTRRPQRVQNLEANAGLQLPLSTLHERRCRLPCKTRFRLAGCASTGRGLNPLDRCERFQVTSLLLPRTFPVARVVFAKPPFAGPEPVLAYLGRYTHRVAIANSRLTRLADGHVDFTWKDYRHHGKTKTMTLAADEFIRRFLLHTVPGGFHRIRHLGFLANGHRTDKLALCRALLAAPPSEPPPPQSYRERYRQVTGEALDVCPDCGGQMQERGRLPRRPPPRRPFWCDSS
jgi:Putative transposase